ncbi:45946_t:CDS:2, partial [Gigaspora margarita]
YILVDKKVYHTNCAAPLPTSFSSLLTTTIFHLEDSRKNLTSIFQNLQNTSQSFQKNPQTTTFDSSAISTSILLTQSIVLSTQSLANPLSNINTNKTFQISQTQSSVKHTYSSKLKSQTNSLSSTLGLLTSTENLQHSSMDIDNTSSDPINTTFNDHTSKTTDLEEPTQSKRDTSNDFDWFKYYPITSEIENNIILNTLGHQFFNFIKPLLIDFAPGKIVKTSIQNNNNKNQKEFKHTFKYLIALLAEKRPKFFLDLILETNLLLDKNSIVLFCIILDTFKSLFLQFTTELFTQLNYKKILLSLSSISLYSIRNRNQVALNLACIHLFLQDKYQTIYTQKFIKELNIKPICFKIHYSFSENTSNKSLFQIQNDNKYNINVALNIPKQQFSQNFRIPSLKPFIQDLDKWFAFFIPTYTRQFTNLSETIDKKIYNHIKYEIAITLATECKKLLPSSFNFSEITLFGEHREAVAKATLYHIYTCNADEHACEILKTTPIPLSNSPKQSIIHPTLDYSIFEKNGTS